MPTKKQLTDQYDSWYGKSDELFADGQPLPMVSRLTEYLTTGSVLDVGGGDGRNALFLARLGFSVTVVDLSEVGLEKIKAYAKKENLPITVKQGDIVDFNSSEKFDVVLLSFVLHHFDTTAVSKLINKLQKLTTAGGVHLIATPANKGELYERARKSGRFYPSEADLKTIYPNWTWHELWRRETTTFARRKDGSRMPNDMLGALIQKPH